MLEPVWGTVSMSPSWEAKSLGWCPGVKVCAALEGQRGRHPEPGSQSHKAGSEPGLSLALQAILGPQTWPIPNRVPLRDRQQGNKVIKVSIFRALLGGLPL